MGMPRLSVIIPTHKRAEILAECVRRLEHQTIADQLEVIVIHDGADETTDALFKNTKWEIPVHYSSITKSQQGIARNRGVQIASAPVVLFIGDDIYLEKDACEVHIKTHATHADSLVLGYTTWDPDADITDVMKWLEQSGWQFGYPMISQYAHSVVPMSMQHRFTYTSHISLPTNIAKQHPFRTDVNLYGWEDIEWGQRIQTAGIPLLYEPDAKALHHHHITMEDSLKRMQTLGMSAVKMEKVVTGFDRVPHGLKRLGYIFASMLPTMAGVHRKAFMKGVKSTER